MTGPVGQMVIEARQRPAPLARVWRGGVVWALFLTGMAMLFRSEWMLPEHRSLGDDTDGVILVATLEHWSRLLAGQAAGWLSPGWFWPADNPIAYTDTYLLMAPAYALARWLGAGSFVSYDLTIASFAAIGFWSFVALARALHAGLLVSAAFAFVLAFGALTTFKLGHGQSYTIMFAPALGLLLLHAWRQPSSAAAAIRAAAAGVLFGLMTLTAPQTAWFLAIDSGLAVIATAAATILGGDGGASLHALAGRGLRHLAALAAGGLAGLAAGFIPVLLIYRQTISTRQRDWSEIVTFLPRPSDILNVPPGTMLWHHLLYLTGIANTAGRPAAEVALGFTPGLLLAMVLGLFIIMRRRDGAPPGRALIAGSLLTPILAWLLTVQVAGFTAWQAIYQFVPGGGGVRTPFRIQLASLFFLCLGSTAAWSMCASRARTTGRTRAAIGVGLLVALCAVEQANPGPSTRDTASMRRWLDAVRRPPFACGVFYLLPQTTHPALPWFTRQADAMLLSQVLGMPTVNGQSSWYPPGWDLFEPDQPGYAAHVADWVAAYGQGASVCGVDPRTGRWQPGLIAP